MLSVASGSVTLLMIFPEVTILIVDGRTDGRGGGGGGGMRRTGLMTFGSGGAGRDVAESRLKNGLFDSASDPVDAIWLSESLAT